MLGALEPLASGLAIVVAESSRNEPIHSIARSNQANGTRFDIGAVTLLVTSLCPFIRKRCITESA
jgi:hypothetical protein